MAGSQGKVHKVAARHVHTHSSGAEWRGRSVVLGCESGCISAGVDAVVEWHMQQPCTLTQQLI